MLNCEHSFPAGVVSINRLLCFALVLSMTFSSALASCGLNPETRRVEKMISELGEITPESGPAIEAAEAAYEKLADDVKPKISNYSDLVAAREELEQLLEADKMTDLWTDFVGEWTELSTVLPAFSPIVSWFGSLVLEDGGTYTTDRVTHSWTVSEDRTQITLEEDHGRTRLDVLNDGDYVKLIQPERKLIFLRSTEIDRYIEERFVIVPITPENFHNYIGDPVYAGKILDEKKHETGNGAWIQPSLVYTEGLVYYGRSEDFFYSVMQYTSAGRVEVRQSYPFDTITAPVGTRFDPGRSAGGTLVFLRSEYVIENVMTDNRTRSLTLSDGLKHTTTQNWYVDVVQYQDYPY